MAEETRGTNRGRSAGAEPRRQRFENLQRVLMDALLDDDIPERLMRTPLNNNEVPAITVLRRILEMETNTVRRVGLTEQTAREFVFTALGTIYTRAKNGDAKCAMWLGDKFLEPYLTTFSQAVNGLAEPEVNDGIRSLLSSLGVSGEVVDGVMQEIEAAAPSRSARGAARAASGDLLEEVRTGASALPVVLDGDHDNEPIDPRDDDDE